MVEKSCVGGGQLLFVVWLRGNTAQLCSTAHFMDREVLSKTGIPHYTLLFKHLYLFGNSCHSTIFTITGSRRFDVLEPHPTSAVSTLPSFYPL